MSLSSRKSSTSLRERLEMLVICPICLEQFKDPKVFPCLHSYCYKCIVKLAENSQNTQTSLICPECQATVEVRYCVFFIQLFTVYKAGSLRPRIVEKQETIKHLIILIFIIWHDFCHPYNLQTQSSKLSYPYMV